MPDVIAGDDEVAPQIVGRRSPARWCLRWGVHLRGEKATSEIFPTMASPGAGLTSARQSAPAASARPSTNARIDASKSALVAVTRIGCGLRRDVPALLPQARRPTVGDPCATHAGERARSDEGQRKAKFFASTTVRRCQNLAGTHPGELRPRPEERRAIGGFHHPCRLCGGGARRPPLQRLI